MAIIKSATAGTMESSDVYVQIEPAATLDIQLESVVYNQFADQIEATIRRTLEGLGVTNGRISVNDKGAIDCVIEARVETAVKRAGGDN